MFVELLAELSLSLKNAGLPYMIIGGQAVLLYGEPRLTRDIDITLGVDTDQLEKVLKLVDSLGFKILPDRPAEFVQDTKVLPTQDSHSSIRIDFIFSNTPYERQALDRVNLVKLKQTKVSFASLEDLIIHKIFAGRPRDIEDVRGVLLKSKDLDIEYIEKWLSEFGKGLDTSMLDIFNSLLNQ